MKISVYSIVYDHFKTLRKGSLFSWSDVFVFYILPLLAAAGSYAFSIRLTKDFHSLSVTLYGIFAPLLLNIQVAVFSIFQRKWSSTHDDKIDAVQQDILETRRQLLAEINTNISYLTLVSCVAIVASITFFATEFKSRVFSSFMILVYTHFFLSLLMIIKRSHVLFQKEYDVK